MKCVMGLPRFFTHSLCLFFSERAEDVTDECKAEDLVEGVINELDNECDLTADMNVDS